MNYLIHIDQDNRLPLKEYLEKLLHISKNKIRTTEFAESVFNRKGFYIYVFEEGGGDWGCYGYSTDISCAIPYTVRLLKKELSQTLTINYGEL